MPTLTLLCSMVSFYIILRMLWSFFAMVGSFDPTTFFDSKETSATSIDSNFSCYIYFASAILLLSAWCFGGGLCSTNPLPLVLSN